MSQQTPFPPSEQAGATDAPRQGGPRVSGDQMRDVDRLRRTTTDRYVAGVAGGLGRHFDIDPTVIRVALVVLTLFGGAGVLIYAAVWALVPEDGRERAAVDVRGDWLRALLIIAAVIALSMVFGTPFFGGGWGVPLPLLVIGLVAVAIYATRNQRQQAGRPPAPWGAATTSAAARPPEGTAMTITDPPSGPTGYPTTGYPTTGSAYADQPPAWMPPAAPAYLPPPRPRRTGVVLFWPTLALIAIALGSLGIYDISNYVVGSAYPALALTITGWMLLVGAFRGRPGGLIALGIAGSLALVITSIVAVATNGSTSSDTVRFIPLSAASVQTDYTLGAGSLEIDLTRLPKAQALAGKVITVDVNAGEIRVLVPEGVDVHVAAEVRFVGSIDINGDRHEGVDQSVSATLPGFTAPDNSETLELILRARVGHITVEQR
ncbi:MAG: PspC domain-containing protein [Marmoricola sp.]